MAAPYPWLDAAWQWLDTAERAERLPQSLLIYGMRGVGKRALAEAFARRLLCESAADRPCGHCHGCRLVEAGSHPHLARLEPEEVGKPIAVGSVRALVEQLHLRPQYATGRVVLVDPADALNESAANALLKILEEPPEGVAFWLLSAAPARLPATLRSRCQRLAIHPPGREMFADWLSAQGYAAEFEVLRAASGGSPLRAVELAGHGYLDWISRLASFGKPGAGDPVQMAEASATVPVELLLDALMRACLERLRSGAAQGDSRHALQHFWAEVLERKRQFSENPQLNKSLLLEDLLLRWRRPPEIE